MPFHPPTLRRFFLRMLFTASGTADQVSATAEDSMAVTRSALTVQRDSDHGTSGSQLPKIRQEVLDIVRSKGYRHFDEPIPLASGELSQHFIDGKAALAHGDDLAVACRAVLAIANASGVSFNAVGGLTLGADHFAHGISMLASTGWFVVRKEPKGRGTNRLIEGIPITHNSRVLLVDDVVSTGGSIKRAYEAVRSAGATVVLATTLVDRGEAAAEFFARQGVLYSPVLTYRDFGIEPVAHGRANASPVS